MKRIDSLTDEQRATFPAWVEKWTAHGLSTTPLTVEQWAEVEAGARKMYGYANLAEPAFVVRAQSPLSAALSTLVIAHVAKTQGDSVGDSVGASVWASVGDSVWASVWASVGDSVGDSVRDSVRASVWDSVGDSVRDSVRDSVGDSVGASVGDSVWASVWDSVGDSVWASVRDSVRASVGASVGDSVRDSVRDSVGDSVWASVRDSVGDSVWASVRASVGDSVWASVGDSVGASVWASVRASVGASVWASVRDSVRDSVWASVWDSVGDSVGASVRDQIWRSYDYGNLWADLTAFYSWFRDVGGLELSGDAWEKFDADCAIRQAGPSLWQRGVFAASDRPKFIHRDQNGALHGENGPAIGWADGWALNVWHGTSVPDDFYTWDIDRALKESNSEIRRCAIERIGWDALTDRLTLVAEADDPGNAPHKISLYDLGKDFRNLYTEPARILVVSNASLDKGGHRRRFGLPVPARHSDPIEAAAALFDVTPEQYRSLARAS